jgi:hypothetical protein
MDPWLRLLAVVIAVIAGALLLKVLPPIVVLVGFVGGVAYVNHRLKTAVKRQARGDAIAILGLRREEQDPFGLLGYPFALFSRGPDPRIEDLVWGTWRGLEVRRFDVSFEHPVAGPRAERPRFACAIAPIGADLPHVVVEPVTFVTHLASEAPMPEVSLGSQRLDRAFVVRCADAVFAHELLDEGMVDWLDALGEDRGFEVTGSLAVLYGPASSAGDVVTVLETLQGFLEHIPAGVREGAGGSAGPPSANVGP